ncbi:hypothetical protein [Aeromicrobium sp.]|uniref:hypothetical protein n=1 Tax=Aeromicrobium sp. TaxID=1871063 RepID=UPI003D6A57ED
MHRLAVFLLGFGIGLAGDACHVASGTTVYDWTGVPTIWKSEIWFPFVVGLAVLAAAEVGHRAGLPKRARGVNDVVIGASVVLALYALTAALRGQPTTVSVVLCAAIAVAVWAWWDPSAGAFGIAAAAAVLGPVAEMFVANYASDSDGLFGVAPWLPCLYFAAGAVASGVLGALTGTRAAAEPLTPAG